MSEKITKKYVQKELKKCNSIDDCKGLLKSINTQIDENKKVIARNARLANELKDEPQFLNDLDEITQVKENWNASLSMQKDKVFEKMDKLL